MNETNTLKQQAAELRANIELFEAGADTLDALVALFEHMETMNKLVEDLERAGDKLTKKLEEAKAGPEPEEEPKPEPVPEVEVDWYKTDGIFTVDEYIGKQPKRMRPFAEAVADSFPSEFHVHATIREEEDIERISRELHRLEKERQKQKEENTLIDDIERELNRRLEAVQAMLNKHEVEPASNDEDDETVIEPRAKELLLEALGDISMNRDTVHALLSLTMGMLAKE